MLDGDTLLGVVDVGAPFGDTFVKSMKSRLGVDVAIHQITDDNVKTLASTIKDITPSKDAIKRALAGESVIVMGERDGQPIATTYGVIKNFSGDSIAVAEIIRNTMGVPGPGSRFHDVVCSWCSRRRPDRSAVRIMAGPWIGATDPRARKLHARDDFWHA